jgi:hypothetical protein
MTVAKIPGVAIAHDTIGNPTQVTIDLKEHPEAIPVLKEMGLMPKTQFDIDFENGIPLEESRKNMMTFIDKLWQK